LAVGAVKARGHFPSEQAALKCLYLVTRSLDPTGTGWARWAMRWKPALNAFAITFGDRFPAGRLFREWVAIPRPDRRRVADSASPRPATTPPPRPPRRG
jgi:hypothetical protein